MMNTVKKFNKKQWQNFDFFCSSLFTKKYSLGVGAQPILAVPSPSISDGGPADSSRLCGDTPYWQEKW